jgi:hypothetical protein
MDTTARKIAGQNDEAPCESAGQRTRSGQIQRDPTRERSPTERAADPAAGPAVGPAVGIVARFPDAGVAAVEFVAVGAFVVVATVEVVVAGAATG